MKAYAESLETKPSIVELKEELRNGRHFRMGRDYFWQSLEAYSEVSEEEFLSNAFQTKMTLSNHSQKSQHELMGFIARNAGEEFAQDVAEAWQVAPMTVQLTPYILSLIDWKQPVQCPIRMQFLPLKSQKCADHPLVKLDSLDEKSDTRAPGIVHRYFDKALFLPQTTCPVYCRFCTRSYAIGSDTQTVEKHKYQAAPSSWLKAFEYLRENPQIEDVVISGGDCYNLHARLISMIARNLLKIEHIKRIRLATKGLAVNPGRILTDSDWTNAVIDFAQEGRKLGKQVVIHTHFNSFKEITWITQDALSIFFQAGVTVRNQSVLLRGVNDSVTAMAYLIKALSYMHVQPYYVYQHDLVSGVDDLRTSLETCLSIEQDIRGLTAGFNTPLFIVDAPGGGGKRDAHSYDYYSKKTGISVFTAPSVKPGKNFLYFDPLHSLDKETVLRWKDPYWQKRMCNEALNIFVDRQHYQRAIVSAKCEHVWV